MAVHDLHSHPALSSLTHPSLCVLVGWIGQVGSQSSPIHQLGPSASVHLSRLLGRPAGPSSVRQHKQRCHLHRGGVCTERLVSVLESSQVLSFFAHRFPVLNDAQPSALIERKSKHLIRIVSPGWSHLSFVKVSSNINEAERYFFTLTARQWCVPWGSV